MMNSYALISGRNLLVFVFAAVYGSLLVLTGIADSSARIYNNPDDGNGDGFNPIISPGDYQPPHSLPLLFPPDAHIALARQAATDGKMENAKQHAFDALKSNPASGEAAQALFDFYTKPELYRITPPVSIEFFEEGEDSEAISAITESPPLPEAGLVELSEKDKQIANKLANISHSLRPTYVTTQAGLSEYWLHEGKPEKAIHGWHIMLTQHPNSSAEIFPLLLANLNKPHMQEVIKPYIDKQPEWWEHFLQYHREHEILQSKSPEKS